MNRVVVTGLGAVTPLGLDVTTFWQRLCAGERGMKRLSRFDPTGLRNENGGEINDWTFDPSAYGLQDAPDLAVQFLLHAAGEALGDAGLRGAPAIGAVLSTNFGGGLAWEDFCRDGSPLDFDDFAFHTALDCLAHAFDLTGPLSLLSIACASGAAAVGYAFDLIRAGKAEAMLAGGHDVLSPSPLSGLSVLHTITAEDIRPFSADRSGTMFGEGAALLVLESLDSARARGAGIYAEVLGSWQNNNAYHLTAPDKGGAGMARVLGGALNDAQLDAAKLDHINAHGTGTKPHDVAETEAIKSVLGGHAYEIPVCSIKGAIAHLMGAAGAVEALACVKTIETGMVPPTVNYREQDPECDLDYVPNEAREDTVRYAATISAGVGGSNACVVFGPPPEVGRGLETPPTDATPVTCAVPAPYALRHDVVVTGVAPISAIGIGRDDFAQGLSEGREGRRAPERLTGHGLPLLAECLDFVVEDYLESEKTYLDRCSELALAACALAWEDAGLDWRELEHERVGLCLGTAFGCLDSMANMTARVQSKGVRFGSPVIFTHSFANTPTSLAAVEYDLQGPTSTFCVGDVSAASALDYAWRIIADGRAEVVLAGGVEALSEPLLRYLAQVQPDYVPGEGACLLVLECAEHAARRGAKALAQVLDVTLRKGESAATIETPAWGHTFAASMALELAAKILTGGGQDLMVTGADGRDAAANPLGASISLRRLP
ncbi:MAG: beta-ketoacyl-[acyl-carrier-protein] synthase family protein [Armatimonadia bacterium]